MIGEVFSRNSGNGQLVRHTLTGWMITTELLEVLWLKSKQDSGHGCVVTDPVLLKWRAL